MAGKKGWVAPTPAVRPSRAILKPNAAKIAATLTKAARQAGGGIPGMSQALIVSGQARPPSFAWGSSIFMGLHAHITACLEHGHAYLGHATREIMMAANLNTGFTAKQRADIVAGLNKVLADSYALYLKTHGYHWNVRGANFAALHVLLEGQYTEQWTALDAIAERIRALGELAPMGYAAFGNLSSIKDGDAEKEWDGMFKELLSDNETVIATLRDAFEAADEAGDEAT